MVQDVGGGLSDETDSPEMSEMARLWAAEADKMPSLRRGDALEGTVILIDDDGVLVNIGAKSEGVIPYREMRTLGVNEIQDLKPGDSIVATMVRQEDTGQYLLSYDRAQAERGWRQLEQEMESGGAVMGQVVGFNRGGLLVESLGVQGFVPLSQLSQEHRALVQGEGEEQHAALSVLVGQELSLKVIEVNRRRQRAILSERMASQEQREEQRAQLMSQLEQGTVRHGRVTGVREFGAFVDLGGADGLIHISELSWEPVSAPLDIVQPGQEVDVYILKVDFESKRISLSLRRTRPDPWQEEVSKFTEGQIVEGTITRLAAFGAFARLEGNIEGLIHISELADQHIRHPREAVKEEETYSLKILRIEPDRRRIGLSLRQVEGQEVRVREAETEVVETQEAETEAVESQEDEARAEDQVEAQAEDQTDAQLEDRVEGQAEDQVEDQES